jgi:hypothetical protein
MHWKMMRRRGRAWIRSLGTYFILHDSARLFLGLGFDIHRHHLTALHLLFTSDTIAYPDKANISGIATASIIEGCPLAIISFNTPRIIDSAMNQSLDESMNERQVSLLSSIMSSTTVTDININL